MEILLGGLAVSFLGKAAWMWLVFLGLVMVLLVLDLGVLHRKEREIGVGESLALVLVFIGGKIFWAQFHGKPDPAIALAVTIGLIGGGVAVSLWKSRPETPPLSQDGGAGESVAKQAIVL